MIGKEILEYCNVFFITEPYILDEDRDYLYLDIHKTSYFDEKYMVEWNDYSDEFYIAAVGSGTWIPNQYILPKHLRVGMPYVPQ